MRIKVKPVIGLAACGVAVAICSADNAGAAAPNLRSCVHQLPLLRASTWSAARRTLVPSGAVELRMCRYTGLNTRPPEHIAVASFFDDSASIAEISRSFDTLPKPPASQAPSCPDDTGAAVIATFAYKSGHTVSVSVVNGHRFLPTGGHLSPHPPAASRAATTRATVL
jgi:hypothetical protein